MADIGGDGAAGSSSSRAVAHRGSGGRALKVVGLALQRWFSSPLPFRADLPRTFTLTSPRMPEHLGQFQEVLDIVLESLPPVDWERCRSGDAFVNMMVRQVLRVRSPRAQDALRDAEPDAGNEQDVFMNLPHNDEYWPGADHFVVSDGPWRTLFYDRGLRSGAPTRFPERAVVKYDASFLHSAPGFCAAGLDSGDRAANAALFRRVLRTFVRIIVWEPRWSIGRLPHFAQLLGPPPEHEWTRPRTCEADDVVHGCFDEEHNCERCCDLSKGPMGDSVCWAGWMTYQKCCGPASRRWAGCGWFHGVDLWAHDYYSLTPPRLHSAAQCQQRCEEDADCGGWTYFPEAWEPMGCRLPLAAILSMRGNCILRAGAQVPPTPHRGLIWGPRDCDEGDGGCLEVGIDRLSWELEISRDIQDAAGCRALCKRRDDCQAFAYFPWDYVGETSGDCVFPAAVHGFWQTRCLLKTAPTAGADEWYLPIGNVVSGSRSCGPAAPWLHEGLPSASSASSPSRRAAAARWGSADALLAVDGNYTRGACARASPFRISLDAAHVVSEVILWTGDFGDLHRRPRRRYVVTLLVVAEDGGESEAPCADVDEPLGGRPVTLRCLGDPQPAARGIIIRAEIDSGAEGLLSVCEVEARLEPVPCKDLIRHSLLIGAWEVRVFPSGAAALVDAASPAGQACERRGGSLVALAAWDGDAACVEASCAPGPCLMEFDADPVAFAGVSGFTIWDEAIERAELLCVRHGPGGGGRYFETTVRVHELGGGAVATMHFGFCAPAVCGDDGAAAVALRLAAAKGVELSMLPPGTGVSIMNTRPFGRWEDIDLDFLVAGFARSGTHSVQGNLALHTDCLVTKEELTFNWGYLPMLSQMREYERYFREAEGLRDAAGRGLVASGGGWLLRGGKGEGVALSPRLLRLLARSPKLKLIVVIREPIEWFESLYNLRKLGCRTRSGCPEVPGLDDVVLQGATFEDVKLQWIDLARAVEDATRHFSGRLLLLEFELLKARPREFFDRICDFLSISRFPEDFSFTAHATSDRTTYTADGTKADLCEPRLRPALEALRGRLAASGEHRRLAELLAASGAPWVSSRLLLGRDHCAP